MEKMEKLEKLEELQSRNGNLSTRQITCHKQILKQREEDE